MHFSSNFEEENAIKTPLGTFLQMFKIEKPKSRNISSFSRFVKDKSSFTLSGPYRITPAKRDF